MRKLLLILFSFAALLSAANYKLYMKDGTWQLIREHSVNGDHLRYYSVERSDWEEIPADLADLKKTNAELASQKAVIDRRDKQLQEESDAAKEERAEIRKIPTDPGVYMLEGGELRIFKLADASVRDKKGRTLLKYLTPIPVVAGKSTLEIPREHADSVVKDKRPEFFLQLSLEDSYGIVKLTPEKGVRVVERITVQPVVNEALEERDVVQVFSKQLTDGGLYKIWPQEDLATGDYAVIEYNEGKIDTRVWDFRVP